MTKEEKIAAKKIRSEEIQKTLARYQRKDYPNQELIDKVDLISQEILSSKNHMYIREKFFGALIDKLELKNGVEVGVDVGEFSKLLLSNSSLQKLYGVDCWPDSFGSDYREGFFDKNGGNRYSKCQENLKEYIANGRCELIKSNSVEAADKFEDGSLDFVYIDGDHSLAVLLDIIAYYPKLKIGGILSGHDWKNSSKDSGITDYFGEQLGYEVQRCTEYFARRNGSALRVVGGIIKSFWMVKNK